MNVKHGRENDENGKFRFSFNAILKIFADVRVVEREMMMIFAMNFVV